MPLQSTCSVCSAACSPRARMCQPCHRAPLYVRFWRYVRKTDACWLWFGAQDRKGYGRIGSGPPTSRQIKATHVSWAMHFGPVPHGYMVLHHCDNPPCVRPDHLFLGTNQDNTDDKVAKGRATGARRGIAHHLATIPAETIEEIRRLHAGGGMLQRDIAVKFGIHRGTVSKIIQRRIRRAG